jgi:hypothetical protein
MFEVHVKNSDNKIKTVYGVKNDANGYPLFLIYTKNQWRWISAKHFVPINAANKIK